MPQVDFTYTIGGVTATCSLEVVKRLNVNGVIDGYYPDLAQGESVQFQSSCRTAEYRSIRYPNIVTRSGLLRAPNDETDHLFGGKNVPISVTGCGQTYQFRVQILPMYPTPKFCGAEPKKWLQKIPDRLPNSAIMTGGTSQVKNRNPKGIIIWEVAYDLLQMETDCCCPRIESTGTPSCGNELASAERLDRFEKQVEGYAGYFSLRDRHTDELFKHVRFTRYTNDHVIYTDEQTRQITMRYEGEPLN